jgi:hypothetical protein
MSHSKGDTFQARHGNTLIAIAIAIAIVEIVVAYLCSQPKEMNINLHARVCL